jgi:hypothetical protein
VWLLEAIQLQYFALQIMPPHPYYHPVSSSRDTMKVILLTHLKVKR